MFDFFSNKLNERKKLNLYRELKIFDRVSPNALKQGGKNFISFSCNDYFNLTQNIKLKLRACFAILKYGVGSGSSRLVTGNNHFYDLLEKELADLKKTDSCLVYSSGYACAIGVISALADKNDLIVADRLIHASFIDAVKLSSAKLFRFKHNDVRDCERLLKENRNSYKKCFILTESVFSMDGDIAPINLLLELAEKYDCYLISDDAHGIGFVNIKSTPIHIQLGTLSKAFGGVGGYVCSNQIIIDYLKNFSRSLIYSTALPPANLVTSYFAIKEIKNLAEKCIKNANYFCNLMNIDNVNSAIVIIKIGDAVKALEISNKLKEEGYIVAAIRPPTVEVNQSRLRITFSAKHKKRDIENLAKIIKNLI